MSIWQASARVGAHPCCSSAEQEAPRRLSRSLPFQKSTCKTCSTWVTGMKNPLIFINQYEFHKWSSKCKCCGRGTGNLFFRLGSRAREEQQGNGVVIPPSQLTVCMCARIYRRKGVFLPIFGADGLKTFVQGLLLTHLENTRINSITCNISQKKGREGEQCGQSGLLGLDYFAFFVKL